MMSFKSVLLITALVAAAAPASAWDGVEAVESSGYLTRWVTRYSSPAPGYCDWRTAEPPGAVFQAVNADGTGNNGCLDPWFVHCDQDSLVYRGVWPLIDASVIYGSHYEAVLFCSVNVVTRTLLSASRSVSGNLTTDIHQLDIEYPDGSTVPILSSGTGPDQAEMILDPGNYRVILVIDAYQTNWLGDWLDPYEGYVLLKWDDPANVPVESLSWGSVKAVFR